MAIHCLESRFIGLYIPSDFEISFGPRDVPQASLGGWVCATHSLFIIRGVLILTMSILTSLEGCICWHVPKDGLMMREWSYTAPSWDVFGCTSPTTKRFPEAWEMSWGRSPKNISRAEEKPSSRQCTYTIHPDSRQCTNTIFFDILQVKEYGYNRELRRFMEIQISTDGFHEKNHTTCSSAFKSSQYCSLKHVNTEAAEQTNKVLRSITSSTTFMSPRLYMKALTLFTANLNLLANNKKKWIVWNDFYWIHNLTFVPEILQIVALILVQRSNILSLLSLFHNFDSNNTNKLNWTSIFPPILYSYESCSRVSFACLLHWTGCITTPSSHTLMSWTKLCKRRLAFLRISLQTRMGLLTPMWSVVRYLLHILIWWW